MYGKENHRNEFDSLQKKDHTNEIDLLQRITKIEKIHKRLMNKTRDNTTKYSQKVQRKITDDSHNRDA